MNREELLCQIKDCDFQKPFAFVSYNSDDWANVYPMVIELQNAGLNIWIDKALQQDIGKNWTDVILKTMKKTTCKMVLFFMSQNSMKSAAVCAELNLSSTQRVCDSNGSKPLVIIPICIDSYFWNECKANICTWSDHICEKYGDNDLCKEDIDIIETAFGKENLEGNSKIDQNSDIIGTLKNKVFDGKNMVNIAQKLAEVIETVRKNHPELIQANALANVEYERSGLTDVVGQHDAEIKKNEKDFKRRATVSGDITYKIYGQIFTENQSQLMFRIFEEVMKKHSEKIDKIETTLSCVSFVNYQEKNNRLSGMKSYFRNCHTFFCNNRTICIGASYSLSDKIKLIKKLISICNEHENIWSIEGNVLQNEII